MSAGRHYNALDGPSDGKWCLCFGLRPVGHKQRLNWLRRGSAAQQAANGRPTRRPAGRWRNQSIDAKPICGDSRIQFIQARPKLARSAAENNSADERESAGLFYQSSSWLWLFWSFARVMHWLVRLQQQVAERLHTDTHTQASAANELLK